jgi:hypothetical protein
MALQAMPDGPAAHIIDPLDSSLLTVRPSSANLREKKETLTLGMPEDGDNWTGDAQLEPLLNSLYMTFRGQLTQKECIAHMQKAAWKLDVGTLHAKLDLRDRDIKKLRAHAEEMTDELRSVRAKLGRLSGIRFYHSESDVLVGAA